MTAKVDQTALKFNQACIIVLLAWAFLFNWPWLVALVSIVMLVGTFMPEAGLFKQFYARVLRPSGLLKPNVVADGAAAAPVCAGGRRHFPVVCVTLFLAGWSVLGWLLTAIVVPWRPLTYSSALCRLFFVLPARPPRHQAIAAVLVIATLSLNTAKPAHPQRVGHAHVPVCEDCQNA